MKSKGYTLDAIAEHIAALYGIQKTDILSKGRQKTIVEARSLFCFIAAHCLGTTITDCARLTGMVPSAISYAVIWGKKIAEEKEISLHVAYYAVKSISSVGKDFVMVRTKRDIFDALERNAAQLRLLGVRRIGLFGSFLRGEQNEESDIDFLVEFEPSQKTFDNFIGVSMLLEDDLGCRVELVTPESLSPYLGPHILREVENVSLVA